MPIRSGRYIITNVQQQNLVTLPDPNDGTPLNASYKQNIPDEQWTVQRLSNGRYLIINVKHKDSFANAGHRAEVKATVEGRNDRQYWLIQRTRTRQQYTIRTTDTRLFWGLEDGEVGTSITLFRSPADLRCWWTFEDAETGTAAEIERGSSTVMPKWVHAALQTIFGPFRRNRSKRYPEGTIRDPIVTGPFSSSQPAVDVPILDRVIPDPLSSSQPELNVPISDLIITGSISGGQLVLDASTGDRVINGPISSSQLELNAPILGSGITSPLPGGKPTANVVVTLLDIPFPISKSRGLLDPVTSVFEALEKVLSAKSTVESNIEWKRPIRRLRFHLDTTRYHRRELESDFKIDGIVPTPDTTITAPLEKYANGLQNIYRLMCDNVTVRSSMMNIDARDACNEETIEQQIDYMDSAFEEYTAALYSFADKAYKSMQKLPSVEQNLLLEATRPHYMQSRRPNTYGVQHKECLPGTRENTIKAIREWANSTSGAKPTFLLLDVAGSGKSTVAKTMAEELGRTRLVARYFFSRDTTETRSTESFCSTVADEFIARNRALKEPIELFMGRPDFNRLSFKDLFNGLVTGPLEQLSLDAILIIDALDECNDEDDSCTDLLEAICSQRVSTPRLRILATGRPELHITRWAQKHKVEWHNFVRLEGGNKDVDLYIQQTLQDLPDTHVPVIKLADGVFIWARIACDLMLKTADVNRLLEELETVVSLDYLYKVALNQSVPKDEGSRRVFSVVLQMILASREPLSIAQLEKLAPEPRIVEQIVIRLGALLVYQGREDPIRLLHATFREFLTTPSKADRYSIQLELGHHTLTSGCIKYIKYQSTQKVSTLDDISQTGVVSFLKGYLLTAYLGFTFTRQSPGCIIVQHRIESWQWILKFWSLSRQAFKPGQTLRTSG